MRTKSAPTRSIAPDSKYGSISIARLINYVMRDGKKSIAKKQVYLALENIEKQTKKPPVEVLEDVIRSITPSMEVRSRRVGGAAYQVPMPVRPRRGFVLAMRWLVAEANKRSNHEYHTFADKLSAEMLDALENKGGAVERKHTAHRMADSNKAFSHFRW